MVNALFWVRKWGDWWYYNSTKNSKTCNWGLKLPSKTCAVWIYHILWNSWPVVHYTVRKTYDIMLPVSLTETCLPWKLHIRCIRASTLPQKHHPLFFVKTLFKSANCLYFPHFGNTAISCFFRDPLPPENCIFQWTPIMLIFL